MTTGCERDTDNDGNGAVHPQGCPAPVVSDVQTMWMVTRDRSGVMLGRGFNARDAMDDARQSTLHTSDQGAFNAVWWFFDETYEHETTFSREGYTLAQMRVVPLEVSNAVVKQCVAFFRKRSEFWAPEMLHDDRMLGVLLEEMLNTMLTEPSA